MSRLLQRLLDNEKRAGMHMWTPEGPPTSAPRPPTGPYVGHGQINVTRRPAGQPAPEPPRMRTMHMWTPEGPPTTAPRPPTGAYVGHGPINITRR